MQFTEDDTDNDIREENYPCPPEMVETVIGPFEDTPVHISSKLGSERAKRRLNGEPLGLSRKG